MAATGRLADAVAAIVTKVTAAGFRAVTDPRNIGPRCVFVQLPTFTTMNANIADITVPIQIIAAPPGNTDATDYLLSSVETLMQSGMAITDGFPITLVMGELELPAYQLTTRLGTRRT